jgi:hypothetical protein
VGNLGGAQALDLLFQFEFLAFQLSKSQMIRGWSLQFFLDGAIKILVPETEFTDMGFNGHGLRLLAIGD